MKLQKDKKHFEDQQRKRSECYNKNAKSEEYSNLSFANATQCTV